MAVAKDGNISGFPSTTDVGVNQFTVEVNDNNGQTDQATLQIEVFDSADINLSGGIGMDDLSLLALRWLDSGCVSPQWCDWADIDRSGDVNLVDFTDIAKKWLQ